MEVTGESEDSVMPRGLAGEVGNEKNSPQWSVSCPPVDCEENGSRTASICWS